MRRVEVCAAVAPELALAGRLPLVPPLERVPGAHAVVAAGVGRRGAQAQTPRRCGLRAAARSAHT